MPYTSKDASRHNKAAKSSKAKRGWSEAFNSALKRYGNEKTAFMVANSAVEKINSSDKRLHLHGRDEYPSKNHPVLRKKDPKMYGGVKDSTFSKILRRRN
ncbi:MAG: ChaB family protein [Rhabdochlamydiaceae bacterium]